MNTKLTELFNQCSKSYDRDRRHFIPCFDEFYGCAVRVIPFAQQESVKILDMGAGTGLFAALIKEALPCAEIILTDASTDMLEQAKRRFEDKDGISYRVMHHEDLNESEAYDMVISALSIHHLEGEAKVDLYHHIFQALKPGGMFINADQAKAPTTELQEFYDLSWREDVLASGISQEAFERGLERQREDKDSTLEDQLAWLVHAGFVEVDCWYKNLRFAVFGGKKKKAERK